MSITVQLAHFSDCHSHFDGAPMRFAPAGESEWRTQCGGYARILTRLNALRRQADAAGQTCLFLHGGDTFQGSLYFNRFKGRANADLLSLLRPDAMVIGNHEFDLGNGPLVEFLRQLDFPVLAANLDSSQEPADAPLRLRGLPQLYDASRPWHQRIIDDVPFALLGITLPQMAAIASPDPHTRFHGIEQTLKTALAEIKAAGIRHIILLSHLGLEQDKQLAEHFPELSLIIGGHTHSLLGDLAPLGLASEGSYPLMRNGVAILHAAHSALCLGVCELTFDQHGRVERSRGQLEWLPWQPWPFASTPPAGLHFCEPAPELEQLLAKRYRPELETMTQRIVTRLDGPLHHQRLPDASLPAGSQVAPLVASAMLAGAREQVGQVDFALHNAGGVRCSLEPGPLSEADIAGRLLPFAIPLTLYRVHGHELAEALEGAIDNATNNGVTGNGSGSFPYTAGVRFCYQADQPRGRRITRLEWERAPGQWQPVEADAIYRGVSSAYTASGKEGYTALARTLTQHNQELGITLADAFIRWARYLPELAATPALVEYQGPSTR
ncbi:bifunctional metallophosphatase/5'-nucleotidase [Aeromonas hydrophila]|uniref:bifunctional metallophosphatase/5'-nucleotidase n=1 Tax=Aeromonas hydrophila TaxID=644 RepID=UPI001C75F99D|nr:bifunctional UDP-sugar hydrolase/5'-nucleotidase [Aeromonas hydrophila]MCR3909425.1 bifunctional metallophosphatase/5'-nucleotidase [Aeromonas hydrophila]QWL69620.1 bifunctional metallophosphatase/5'-nucleotidase [Aeromonas hydrophila]